MFVVILATTIPKRNRLAILRDERVHLKVSMSMLMPRMMVTRSKLSLLPVILLLLQVLPLYLIQIY